MIEGELDPEVALQYLGVAGGFNEALGLVLGVKDQTKAAFVVVLYIRECEIAEGVLDVVN